MAWACATYLVGEALFSTIKASDSNNNGREMYRLQTDHEYRMHTANQWHRQETAKFSGEIAERNKNLFANCVRDMYALDVQREQMYLNHEEKMASLGFKSGMKFKPIMPSLRNPGTLRAIGSLIQALEQGDESDSDEDDEQPSRPARLTWKN